MIRRKDEPADYCFVDTDPASRLTPLERLTLTGGKELDKAISWMAKQFDAVGRSHLLSEVSRAEVDQILKDYAQSGWLKDPASFFVHHPGAPLVQVTPIHGLSDGIIEDLCFESRGAPHHARVREMRASVPQNERVHVRLWRHFEPPKGTMIAIHGWTMGDQRINSLAFLPGVFYQLGLDVALIELPYHGRRRPQQIVPMDPILTSDAIAQGISDLRDTAAYLHSIGRSQIGVVGMSLGGYFSALWASLDPLAFCIPIVPLVSLAELEWEILTRQPNFEAIKADGLTSDHLRQIYSVHSPLTHQLKIPKDRTVLIAGLGDTVVPARQPKMLWDHWKRPQIHWFSGGHVAQFKRSKAFGEVIKFLTELELIR